MQIHGFNKTTLLDYPGMLASTVFTGHCNFRCPFCHNSDLVLDPSSQPLISEEEIFDHLRRRSGIVKGVCITGGEPTLQPDLPAFMKKLKDLGVLVKLDTNGYRPDVLKEIIKEGTADYIAMDIKASFEDYSKVCGTDIDTSLIKESISLIMESGTDYEFRTTVVKELHNAKTFEDISEMISGAEKYFLQGFIDSDRVMKHGFTAYGRAELEKFSQIVGKTVKNVEIRGVD